MKGNLREAQLSVALLLLALTGLSTTCGGGGGTGLSESPNSNPVPSVTSLDPASVPAGAASQTLTINGANFLSSSTATYNGVARSTTFVSATQMTIPLSANDQATAGVYPVVVTNPSPGGGASNAMNFTVNKAGNPVPAITSLSPAQVKSGTAAQALTINGANFVATSTATYNAVPHAAAYISATQLTIQLTASDQATAGSYPVVVTNPSPGGGASNAINLTVNKAGNPVPAITSLSPAEVPAGAAAQTLTISGTNFLASSTATYNAVPHTVTDVSATQLTIQLSASDQAAAGSYPVVVTNPSPGGGVSNTADVVVSATSNPGMAQLTNPADGATDVDPAVDFTWTKILNAQGYQLSLSTVAPGDNDAWQSAELPNISSLSEMNVAPNTLFYYNYQKFTPPALQANTRYYARMGTEIANTWYYSESTFTTGYGIARLTSKANWDGAGGVGATTTFTWNSVADATAPAPYDLYVGTQPGQLGGGVCTATNACVWQTGPTAATSATIPSGVLQPNTAYYASLWTEKNGQWQLHADSAFSTGSFSSSSPTLAQIVYPASGASNVDPFGPVRWTTVPSVTGPTGQNGHFLYIGDGTSGNSANDYVYFGQTPGNAWEGGLVGGRTYYATPYTFAESDNGNCQTGCWSPGTTVTFTTAPVATPPDQADFYASIVTATQTVRNMAAGDTDIPFAHTFLYNNTQPGGVALCSDFANNLMAQLTKQGIVAHRRDTVFGGGPESHSIVEYWDPFLGKWAATDSFFGMTFYDPSKNPQTMGIDEIAQALVQGNESDIPNTFVTSASVTPSCPTCYGSYWDMNYDLDPILHYLNPLSLSDQSLEQGAANDPTQFMLSISSPVGVAATYVFSFANATDSVTINSGGKQIKVVPQPSTAPTGAPINFGNFSGPISLTAGWSYVGNPPAGMNAKRLECPMYHGPACP